MEHTCQERVVVCQQKPVSTNKNIELSYEFKNSCQERGVAYQQAAVQNRHVRACSRPQLASARFLAGSQLLSANSKLISNTRQTGVAVIAFQE